VVVTEHANTLDAYLNQAAPRPTSTQGNSPWAAARAGQLADVVRRYSARRPRSLQKHLGPSELGVSCDRQVVGKLLGVPTTNHVTDPWPSFMGTAGHAEMEDVFAWENTQLGSIRYMTEERVFPGGAFAEHPGTADLYDAWEACLGDHKFLGATSMDTVKSPAGPPRKYQAQLGIYGLGEMAAGRPVKRVALFAWPRTGSSLAGLYVWEHAMDAQMAQLLYEVADDTKRRKAQAAAVAAGQARWSDVPREPDHHECYFCPFYRPGVEDGVGCPGTVS
jgi:hypothetical protein